MAVLSDAKRAEACAELQRTPDCPGTITKAQLRAAIDALDDYMDANAAAMNNALPVAARTGLTTKQKARLLAFVVLTRYGVI